MGAAESTLALGGCCNRASNDKMQMQARDIMMRAGGCPSPIVISWVGTGSCLSPIVHCAPDP
jgi:hypothetical protein